MTESITLVSFGYRNGAPKDTTHNFNLRNLPNVSKSMRDTCTGLHSILQNELMENKDVQAHYKQVYHEACALIHSTSRPSHLRIGFGCDVGRHRSVAIVEVLVKELRGEVTCPIYTEHRDLEKRKNVSGKQGHGRRHKHAE